MPTEPLLLVDDLRASFHVDGEVVRAVEGVSFSVGRGETLAIVGESGSGKSVSTHALMGLLPRPPARIEGGRAVFDGVDLLRLTEAQLRRIRGKRIAMIFQDPMTSLNPFLRVGRQLTEVLELHEGLRRGPARQRSIEMLELVGIPDPERRFDAWPHEMSGGMRQRVMIAMALLCQPELLIADEPTTALDVTIQAQILDILRDLQRRLGVATIFITHDLGVVAGIADRVLVMYAGKVMETAPVDELFENPRHPYTEALLRTMPRLDEPARETLYTIEGQPPDPAHKPPGCPFHPRCRYARDVCRAEFPPAVVVREGHTSFCWASEEVGAVAPTGSSR